MQDIIDRFSLDDRSKGEEAAGKRTEDWSCAGHHRPLQSGRSQLERELKTGHVQDIIDRFSLDARSWEEN